MLKLSSHITIEEAPLSFAEGQGVRLWEFSAVASCKILEDTDTLTDTCEIILPKKISWVGTTDSDFTALPIRRGDKITIQLGYDNQLKTRFIGYIRSIDAKTPITIKCEDSMFVLKLKKAQPMAWKKASLKEVLTHLLQGTDIDFQLIDNDIQLGSYRIVKPTISEELQELKEKYLLSSYFRMVGEKNVLYVGLKYPLDNRQKHIFRHGKNIISEDFEYKNKDDIKVKIEAESFYKNKKTSFEYGDLSSDGGHIIKIRVDNLSEEELKKYAEKTLENYKKDGFKGSFETFGTPEVSKCDMVQIFASDGNSGTYFVKKNEIELGMNGYRQKIELGNAVQ